LNPTQQHGRAPRRLQALTPTILNMAKLSGAPGVSIGVRDHNKVIYTDNFGFPDLENRIALDENALYYIGSLGKAFTVVAVGILINRKKLRRDTPMSQLLTAFTHIDPRITKEAALVDLCSRRTGLVSKNHMRTTEFGHLTLPRDEITFHYLSRISVSFSESVAVQQLELRACRRDNREALEKTPRPISRE
jgi:CubicO group peptidase (beta-lactamase class C family)